MESFEIFKKYLKSKISFTEEEYKFIKSFMTERQVTKGSLLLKAGDICKFNIFVVKGLLKSYVIDENGKEHIVKFSPENWWMSDRTSLMNRVPSHYYIMALEDSELLLCNRNFEKNVVKVLPEAAYMYQKLYDTHIMALERRIINLIGLSAEERYLDFMKTYPNLANRVHQKMIASYLGIEPKSLSRIKKDFPPK